MSSLSAWKRVPINEVYEGLYDGPHATPTPTDKGPVFLGIGNITEDGHLELGNVRHISEDRFPEWTKRVTPRAGDIVFTYEATLNRYAIIPPGFRGCLGRRLALIRPNANRVDTRFLHYSFFSRDWRDTIKANILAGATVDRIPLTRFPDFPISLPPLPTQRRIASVLSAYDDLIENNTRRIAILEEMARRLYEEWFVQFRFPGHEEAEFVETECGSIPSGWAVAPFVTIAEVLSGGTPKKTEPSFWDGTIPFFTPRDAPQSTYALNTADLITEAGLAKCNSKLYPKDTVFITARGTVGKVALASQSMAMNQSCYALRATGDYGQLFLYLATKATVHELRTRSHGAVFDTIIVDTFRQLQVVVPEKAVARTFEEQVRPLFAMVLNLQKKNANLRAQRDLLLPKLISGEIDVSNLPLPGTEDQAA